MALLSREGLEPYIEEYQSNQEVDHHKHPFDEVRIVYEGELMVDVSGNQLLLRKGDRIEIPANTRHMTKVQNSGSCRCICAIRC